MRAIRLLGVFGTLVFSAYGQIAGPVEGIIFDPGASGFRAIVGRIGSSSLGPVLQSPFDFGSVAPRRDYAVATRDGVIFLVTGFSSGSPSATPLPQVLSQPDGAAWSDDGTTLVLYSSAGGWIQSVKGLPGEPRVGSLLSLASLGGALSAVGVSPRGEHVVIGLSGDATGVFELDGQSFVPLMDMQDPISFAFSADAGTLFALDPSVPQVGALSFIDRSVRILPISDLTDPIAIAIAPGIGSPQSSATLFAAGRRDSKLSQIDLSTSETISTSALSFEPQGIQALGHGTFLFGTRREASDPLWSFVAAPTPSIYFRPATPLEAAGGNQ